MENNTQKNTIHTNNSSANLVQTIFKTFGLCIIVIGIVFGLLYLDPSNASTNISALIMLLGALGLGLAILWFAEVLKYLSEINKKLTILTKKDE